MPRGRRPKPKPKPVRVASPGPLALDPSGALVIGDRALKRVVRFDLRTKRRTVLASGFPEAIVGVAYDDLGRLYVSAGDRVYRIEGKRKVVVAGTGVRGHSGDGGPATVASLGGAGGVDVDHDEAIAIAEYDNWIRVVDPVGSISTAAGNGGEGYAGDGGPAREALMGHPHDVLWRRDGVLLIADSHNGVLRRVDAVGTDLDLRHRPRRGHRRDGCAGRRAVCRRCPAGRAPRRTPGRCPHGRRVPARSDRDRRRRA